MVKPILFNTEMVCAILAGRKTVTRRVVKPQPETNLLEWLQQGGGRKSPYNVDDILYVRETWAKLSDWIDVDPDVGVFDGYIYKADWDNSAKKTERPKWTPSIHMPKEAARIFLRVTNVSVTKLQDITTTDMQKEGLTSMAVFAGDKEIARQEWALLWNSTIPGKDYNKYCFSANPWVWVIEFERTEKPNGI
ncbi:MAG: hypothetical protein IK093_17765 [Ruminiclostridium sp.]|nr:hypothetical protein [Ruminiclostridium sp.]